MRIAALIVAAGRGERAGGGLPKQYRALTGDRAGDSVLRRSAETFARHPEIDLVQVVIDPAHEPLYTAAVKGLAAAPWVAGGATRQASVLNGLRALKALPGGAPDLVLIHDAARCFVRARTISQVIAALAEADGALPALPVTDTLKRRAGAHLETVDRADLYRAQTPQGFRFDAILAAHERFADHPATDDAALAEMAGLSVALTPGDEGNVKLTVPEDFVAAGQSHSPVLDDVRTGNGFDVHRFEHGDHVTLCGVRIPHDQALAGHSDADVGLHALTDAILGALAEGDIGTHFPPTDERWRGADSAAFLAYAAERVRAHGGRLTHLDVTLICERPKIGPHRAAMTARIAEILGLAPECVSVKATTTERLGFTGRREGIAALATATLALPRTSA